MNTPHLWTRRTKIIEPRDPLIIPSGFSGWLKCRVLRPDGRVRMETQWFPNLITDLGLDAPGTTIRINDACVVGTGNTAPANSDIALVAEIASTTNDIGNESDADISADRYTFHRTTFRFGTGDAEGNLTEIGIEDENGVLWSRALILDGGGSPTTLTVLADEALDVTYELRAYPNIDDVVTTFVVSGVTYDITIRPMQIANWGITLSGRQAFQTGAGFGLLNAYNGAIGAITGSPSGSSDAASKSTAAYVNGSRFREYTSTWGLTAANFSPGITAFRLPQGSMSSSGSELGGQRYQVGIDGGEFIPKTASNQLALNWRHTWDRRSI